MVKTRIELSEDSLRCFSVLIHPVVEEKTSELFIFIYIHIFD